MATQDITIQNFAGGEQHKRMVGRFLLPIQHSGCTRVKNGIILSEGGWEYRTGFQRVHHTRLNQIADIFRFQFNKEQNYQVEVTNKKFRFYRNEELILDDTIIITDITETDPGVVETIGVHGYSDGDEVFLNMTGLGGMEEVDGKFFLIDVLSTTTFAIQDEDGNDIDASTFTTFTSGTCARITEIDTPYREDLDLFVLKKAQTKDVMYIYHPFYEPRKLTRTDHNQWTFDRYVRTNDPFLLKFVITDVSIATTAVVTAAGHPYVDEEIVILDEIVGTVGNLLNSQPFLVDNVTASTFELFDVVTGLAVDTTGLGYTSDGFASNQNLLPAAVAFFQSRIWSGGMFAFPQKFIASRAPEGPGAVNPGDPRYDDFTKGTDPDHAIFNSISDSEVNAILWFTATDDFLLAGTFGSEARITGSTSGTATSPSSIKATPINKEGVADIEPINKLDHIFYIQAGALDLTSLRFEFDKGSHSPRDHNLLAGHITKSGIKKIAWQSGRPDVVWGLRNDGLLVGMSFEANEGIAAWSRHTTGSIGEDKFISVSTMSRPDNRDQVWAVAERLIGGNTRREVCFMGDQADIPEFEDYFTEVDNEDDDTARFLRDMAEAQKTYNHLDSSLTFDGRTRGLDLSSTVTPGALTGIDITFSSDVDAFLSTDVGREIRKRSSDGLGDGRAVITEVTDPQNVVCKILQDFDSVDPLTPGNWYLTTRTLKGAEHLEGRPVVILGDGAPIEGLTVSGGQVTLPRQVSVGHLGLDYEGLLIPMPVEYGGVTGAPIARKKVIMEMGFRFLNTLGAEFGTDLYKPKNIPFTKMPIQVGNPSPLRTGIERVPFNDTWETDKIVYLRQRKPLPCTLLGLVLYGETEEA